MTILIAAPQAASPALTILVAATAALSATSGLGVVLSRRPLYAALSLVVNMLSLAILFVVLSAQFLAAAQIIVYAGAVMVLFVFVITLLNPLREDSPVREPVQVGIAVFLSAAFMALAAVMFLGTSKPGVFPEVDIVAGATPFGSIQDVGTQLFNVFAFPFEVTSLVLVVAAVGAVYLSRGK
ncbi:MAG: NADH-quinone oxidoreductase subunit [Chloroflexota bacterium]|jgi:NADH-quinone oxidoreductase subunit J|nr:NADH-quinone oxidoreductase subunit [Chloroflexota bacterium]